MAETVQEWDVKTTVVKRIDAHHRVFAATKAEAIRLVLQKKGKRVSREERVVEKPSQTARRWKGASE